jgi:hypothetical protein
MRSEPVLTATTIAGVIVALASIFHVVLDLGTVQTIITAVLPVIAGLLARQHVTPTK